MARLTPGIYLARTPGIWRLEVDVRGDRLFFESENSFDDAGDS